MSADSILAVSYYRPRKWLTELQRTLVLLITKLVTSRVYEQHKDEAAWAEWLAAPLFKAGLQLAPAAAATNASGGDGTPEDQHEAQFLRDFIALAGPGAELHRKMNRAHLSASALQLSSISSQSGPFSTPLSLSLSLVCVCVCVRARVACVRVCYAMWCALTSIPVQWTRRCVG
jgi:hypothetical protein